jgi:hypothetical protein
VYTATSVSSTDSFISDVLVLVIVTSELGLLVTSQVISNVSPWNISPDVDEWKDVISEASGIYNILLCGVYHVT